MSLALAWLAPAYADNPPSKLAQAAESKPEVKIPVSSPSKETQAKIDELVYEASMGNNQKLLPLLNAGIDPNAASSSGTTALTNAASLGFKDTIKLLIAHGANPNLSRPKDGWAALILASYFGYCDAANVLLESGANVNVTNLWGETALFHAASQGQERCVEVLLAHGADPAPKNDHGYDALMVAKSRTYSGIAKKIESAIEKQAKK